MDKIQTLQAREVKLSPLPTIASGKTWTGAISKEEARAAFDAGSHNLKLMVSAPEAPEWLKKFSPLSGHRPEDGGTFGSSVFFKEVLESDRHPLDDAVSVELHPGHGGPEKALVFTVESTAEVGTWYPLDRPMRVVIRRVHGSLQAVLEKPMPVSTTHWTFVLTNEGESGWVLASAYPGIADPDPDMSGLNEGDEISLEEAARRGLRVKA